MRQNFDFELLVDLCRKTHVEMQRRSVRAVDTGLAARNWLLGWYIVEYEQKGADRAVYGAGLLKKLSAELGKGFSIRSLRQFRAFYMHQKAIRQTPSAESHSGVNILKSKALEIRQTLSAELALKGAFAVTIGVGRNPA